MTTTAPLRVATVTLVLGQPLYCSGCAPRRVTLGVTFPSGFRTNRNDKHTYTFLADGTLLVVCGQCGDSRLLRIDTSV